MFYQSSFLGAIIAINVCLVLSCLVLLQSALNAAARLTHRSSRSEHVTPMLRDLHWLCLRNALTSSWLCSFIDVCMVWRHGISPITSSASPIPTAVISGLAASDPTYMAVYCRRSCISGGTVSHPLSPQLQRLLFLGATSRLIFFQIISLITVGCIQFCTPS